MDSNWQSSLSTIVVPPIFLKIYLCKGNDRMRDLILKVVAGTNVSKWPFGGGPPFFMLGPQSTKATHKMFVESIASYMEK